MYAFDGQNWKFSESIKSQLNSQFKVVSYNVLHDMDRNHIMLPKQRYEYQLNMLEEMNVDVIGLCEVTPSYLELIKSTDWIRESYFLSEVTGETLSSSVNPEVESYHGCLILSKAPMKITPVLVTKLSRKIIIGEATIGSSKLGIAMRHTTAFQQNYNRRQSELVEIFDTMRKMNFETSIVMGDLNLHHMFEDTFIDEEYVDTWSQLSCENGYSYDAIKNLMIYEKLPIAFEWRQMRLDRILIKSNVDRIFEEKTVEETPRELRAICYYIQACGDKLSLPQEQIFPMIAGFILLRYICPGISSPNNCGIVKDVPPEDVRGNLTILAKVFQKLGNLETFGDDAKPMQAINDWIEKNKENCVKYLGQIVKDPKGENFEDLKKPEEKEVKFEDFPIEDVKLVFKIMKDNHKKFITQLGDNGPKIAKLIE